MNGLFGTKPLPEPMMITGALLCQQKMGVNHKFKIENDWVLVHKIIS